MKEDRRFTNLDGVSKYLFCSICLEVFQTPTRMRCGHTYCEDCIKSWAKQANTCPQCRERFSLKTNTKDLLAQNLIRELKVKCGFKGCSWVGSLGDVESHEAQCTLHPDRIAKWMTSKINQSSCGLLLKLYEANPTLAKALIHTSSNVSPSDTPPLDLQSTKNSKRTKAANAHRT